MYETKQIQTVNGEQMGGNTSMMESAHMNNEGRIQSQNQVQDSSQTQVHPDVVAYVASKMPDMDDLFDVAELFKAFGDMTRAKIICALTQSEMCVSDLAVLLEMNQSAVSHQLRMLKQVRLVKTRRDGKVRYYSLADEHIQKLFQVAFEHILEE